MCSQLPLKYLLKTNANYIRYYSNQYSNIYIIQFMRAMDHTTIQAQQKEAGRVELAGQDHSQAIEFSVEEQRNYSEILHNWKINQRNSLSKRQCQSFSPLNDLPPVLHQGGDRTLLIRKYTPEVVCYLKAKFVLEELIQQFEQRRLIDMTQTTSIQFLYLLSFRAWCDIHSAVAPFLGTSSQLQHNSAKSKNKEMEDEGANALAIPMLRLSEKVDKVFEFYHKTLTLRVKSFRFRLRSLMDSIFHSAQKSVHDRFLFGVEGKDFQRREQIQYTQKNCIGWVRKKLLQFSGKGPMRMRKIVTAYCRIMLIEFKVLEGFDQFQILKRTIIEQEDAKYKTKPTLF